MFPTLDGMTLVPQAQAKPTTSLLDATPDGIATPLLHPDVLNTRLIGFYQVRIMSGFPFPLLGAGISNI